MLLGENGMRIFLMLLSIHRTKIYLGKENSLGRENRRKCE